LNKGGRTRPRRPLIQQQLRPSGLLPLVGEIVRRLRGVELAPRVGGDVTRVIAGPAGGGGGGGGAALTVQEEDGTPIDTAVIIIRVPNGGLVDNGSGDVSLGYALAGAAPAAHGISAHTGHANWKVLYTDGSGDEQELSLGAAPSATLGHTYLRSAGASSPPTMAQEMKTVTIVVENPTATEDILVSFFFQAVTIREVQAGVVGTGSPSVTINPVHGTDRSAAGTALLNAATAITNTTTGQNLTSFTDNTLAADEMLRLKTTAKSGTVTELWVTFRYTVD